MSFFVYILYSLGSDAFYRGQTNDMVERLKRHNSGYENFTKNGIPWTLLWITEKKTRKEALLLEKKMKNLSRKKLVSFMFKYQDDIAGPDALTFIRQWSGC